MRGIQIGLLCCMFSCFVHFLAEESCDNKYKNLVRLQEILQDDPYAQVPPFFSITSERIEQFLSEKVPGIFDRYRLIVSELSGALISIPTEPISTVTNKPRSFVVRAIEWVRGVFGKNLPMTKGPIQTELDQSVPMLDHSAEELLIDLQDKIQSAFSRQNDFTFTPEELAFFEAVSKSNHFLMVRSSGLEDSKTTANAGLYVSVPYVWPIEHTVRYAMGRVVVSYFNIRAITNNIAAGLDLLAIPLCIPVLLQELIGEAYNSASDPMDIPISGVAFTTNSALSTTDFSVTEINAAYGHGEGVVASRVPVDRFYMTQSRISDGGVSIYPMITYKRQRLVYTQPQDIGLRKNPDALAWRPALNEVQLHRLYAVLKKIETAYGQPMDIEFVVKNEVIYIVQARPAMHHVQTPSYIPEDVRSEGDVPQPLAGITIVSGSSEVCVITDARDLLIKDTLDEADADERRMTAQAVVVGAWASPLSHAAVNFMGVGIPCMYVFAMGALKQLAERITPATPLIIDVQRRQIYIWENAQSDVRTAIVTGWYEHPIQRALSLMTVDTYRAVRDVIIVPQDAVLVARMASLRDALGAPEQVPLFEDIVARITDRLTITEKRMQTMESLCDAACQNLFTQFKKRVHELIDTFKIALDQGADRFELLFYHKMLEALLYQDHTGLINAYTYRWFLDNLYASQRVYGRAGPSTDLLGYGRDCPAQELLVLWQQVLTKVLVASVMTNDMQFNSAVKTLAALLGDLENMNGAPLWFATVFYKSAHAYDNSVAQGKQIVSDLAHTYTQAIKEQMALVVELQDALAASASMLTQSITSKNDAETLWAHINKILIVPLTDAAFVAQFNQSSMLTKLLLCREMRQIVDRIDEVIKMVKSNSRLSMTDRKVLFIQMLTDFFHLSRTWLTDIMPEESLQYDRSLVDYLNKQKLLIDLGTPKAIDGEKSFMGWLFPGDPSKDRFFQKSPTFSVQAAMIGSNTAFNRHYPETPEDMFMLIHQNSLMAVSATFMSLFKGAPLQDTIYLPPLMRDSAQHLSVASTSESARFKLVTIGLEYTPEKIALLYNIPLSNHSATLQIVYDNATQETAIQCQFLGEARARWQNIALLAAASPELSGLTLQDTILFDAQAGIVAWAWLIKNINEVVIIINYLGIMSRMSNHDWSDFNLFDLTSLNTTRDSVGSVFQRILPLMQDRIRGELKGNWRIQIRRIVEAENQAVPG
jgi:hypothetical protein